MKNCRRKLKIVLNSSVFSCNRLHSSEKECYIHHTIHDKNYKQNMHDLRNPKINNFRTNKILQFYFDWTTTYFTF